jgi:ectoine hydroxylase-related dioxygenase (phytanoyl-CoA dioxygenase family)
MRKLFHADMERYLATLRQVNKLFSVYRVLTSKKIIEFVKSLGLEILSFPTDSVFHCMAGDLIIPGGYMRLTPHQDWPAMQSSLDSVIVWSSFMDVLTPNMFPLEIIPKSHINGLLPGITRDHVYEVSPEYYNKNDFVPIYINRGDVIIFSSFTIHRTGSGNPKNIRLACSIRYENVIEKTNIERSYPNIHRRILDRTIRTENFPITQHVKPLFE